MPPHATPPGIRFPRRLLCGLAAALLLGGPTGLVLSARVVNIIDGVVPGAGGAPGDANAGVTVPDSMEAAKDLETARAMERQKDWTKAAVWYQTVLDKYRSKVALVPNQPADAHLYLSVTLQVRMRLSAWPAEGIAAYRARYESTAAPLLQQAGRDDLATLNQIFNDYFLTQSAKTAGLRLIDAHLERGEFDRAAQFADLLLNSYPAADLQTQRPALLFRAALAHHLCGNTAQAQAYLAQLKEKFPQARGTLFAQEVNWAQALETQMRISPAAASSLPADSWPMFGGTPDRAAISQGGGRAGTREYVLDLAPPKQDNASTPPSPQRQAQAIPGTIHVMPAVDADELFFQDGRRIWAVNLESGVPLSGWAQTYNTDSAQRGQYVAENTLFPRSGLCSLTLTPDLVLAVMGQNDRATRDLVLEMRGVVFQAAENQNAERSQLVCLDRHTGRPHWAKAILPSMLPEENLRDLDFCDSPLAIGNNVFVLGYGGKDREFDNCYLLCFDLADGHYKWSCFIASISANFNVMMRMRGGPVGPISSIQPQMACSGGHLYVLSNLGALACIDMYSGSMQWLTTYPHQPNANAADMAMNPVVMQPMIINGRPIPSNITPPSVWAANPVSVVDGRIFVWPGDSKSISIYNAADGSLIKEIDPAGFDAHRSDAATLLAVMGQRLFFCDGHRVWCIDWKAYDKDHPRDCRIWPSAPTDTPEAGRAFVTADCVFLPTEAGLLRISQANGKILDRCPPDPLSSDEAQKEGVRGNIVVTGEHVIIAGKNAVSVYTDMDLACQKLDAEIAAAPTDPDPHLRYAEIMFAAGQMQATGQKIAAAVRLLGSIDTMRPGPSRERLFNDALTWAQNLSTAQVSSGIKLADVLQMFDLAGHAAYGDRQQVDYRMSRAKFVCIAREAGNAQVGETAAVALYQQILSNPAWRSVPRDLGAGQGFVPAAPVVEGLINQIIQRDPSAYADVEKQAEQALADAQAAQPKQMAQKFLDVADTFPNSQAAPRAMLLAADHFERDGNAALATHVLRGIYHKYSDRSDNAHIIQAMARNYLQLAQQGRASALGVALRRLAKAAEHADNLLDQPLTLPSGQTLPAQTPLKQAYEALALWQTQHPRQQPLPEFHIPFSLTPAQKAAGQHSPDDPFAKDNALVVEGVARILPTPIDSLIVQPTDRLVVQLQTNQLAVYAAGQAQPLTTTQPLDDEANGLVWLDGSQKFIVWTSTQIAAVDAKSGAILWQKRLSELPSLELVQVISSKDQLTDAFAAADADAANDARINAANGPGIVVIGGQVVNAGQILRIGGQPMELPNAPEPPPGPEQITHVCATHDGVVLASSHGRVVYLHNDSGATAWETRLTNYDVKRLLACDDFTVLYFIKSDQSAVIATLDNYDAQILSQRKFPAQPMSLPVNIALSDDGLLAWTLPDRIQARDLYEPGNAVMDSIGANTTPAPLPPRHPNRTPPLEPIYAGMDRPDQLLIVQNNILALSQQGRQLIIHSLSELQATLNHPGFRPNTVPLGTLSAKDTSVFLRLGGSWVYCVGTRSLQAFNLQDPIHNNWGSGLSQEHKANICDAFVGKDEVVLLDKLGGGQNGAIPLYVLQMFSRQSVVDNPTHESGQLMFAPPIRDRAGIDPQWQPVDGGFYYLTAADQKLHFLRGLRTQ